MALHCGGKKTLPCERHLDERQKWSHSESLMTDDEPCSGQWPRESFQALTRCMR